MWGITDIGALVRLGWGESRKNTRQTQQKQTTYWGALKTLHEGTDVPVIKG